MQYIFGGNLIARKNGSFLGRWHVLIATPVQSVTSLVGSITQTSNSKITLCDSTAAGALLFSLPIDSLIIFSPKPLMTEEGLPRVKKPQARRNQELITIFLRRQTTKNNREKTNGVSPNVSFHTFNCQSEYRKHTRCSVAQISIVRYRLSVTVCNKKGRAACYWPQRLIRRPKSHNCNRKEVVHSLIGSLSGAGLQSGLAECLYLKGAP